MANESRIEVRVNRNEEDIRELENDQKGTAQEFEKLHTKLDESNQKVVDLTKVTEDLSRKLHEDLDKVSKHLDEHPEKCPALKKFMAKAMQPTGFPLATAEQIAAYKPPTTELVKEKKVSPSTFPIIALLEKLPIPKKYVYTAITLGLALAVAVYLLNRWGVLTLGP